MITRSSFPRSTSRVGPKPVASDCFASRMADPAFSFGSALAAILAHKVRLTLVATARSATTQISPSRSRFVTTGAIQSA